LIALAREARAEARRAMTILRAIAAPRMRRAGYGLRWSLQLPLEPTAPFAPEQLQAYRAHQPQLLRLHRVVDRHVDLLGCLAEIEVELAAPGTRPLSAPARAMLAAPRWAEYAWLLREPGRQLAALGI
jgi:hypothetical protein